MVAAVPGYIGRSTACPWVQTKREVPGARSPCLRAQRGSRAGRCGWVAGSCGVMTAGRGMGRAGVAVGRPERHSRLPGPRPEAAAGVQRKVTVGPGGPTAGGGLRRSSRPGAGSAGAGRCGRPGALPPHAWPRRDPWGHPGSWRRAGALCPPALPGSVAAALFQPQRKSLPGALGFYMRSFTSRKLLLQLYELRSICCSEIVAEPVIKAVGAISLSEGRFFPVLQACLSP